MERRPTPENDDSPPPPLVVNDSGSEQLGQVIALEPSTLPNHPLRVQDVPGLVPKMIG
jgi:hypothetical protein